MMQGKQVRTGTALLAAALAAVAPTVSLGQTKALTKEYDLSLIHI